MERLKLDHSGAKSPLRVLVVTSLVVSTYLGFTYFHPLNNEWLLDGTFSWTNTMQFIFIDQIAIEFFTYYILIILIGVYSKMFQIESMPLTVKGWLTYQLRFLPLFLIAFLIFNPVTQSLRYVYHYFPGWNADVYFEDYFYSMRLYLTYLFPILLGGYVLLNLNLYRQYIAAQSHLNRKQIENQKLYAFDEAGKTIIDLPSVVSFEREERQYYALTTDRKLRISHNLNKLQKLLDPSLFLRINRSAIINLGYLKNYSFWEHDKYIVRMNNGKEFIASRERIKSLKSIQINAVK
jgi:hypothetical protein